MSTVATWLAEREPAPPPALLQRLRAALDDDAQCSANEASNACLRAGERLLTVVLRQCETNRDCALDLLAADALVTYAFEAASVAPDALPERAASAMMRIAAVGLPSAQS